MAHKPLKTGFTRVFLIEGRARPDHSPAYVSTLKLMSVSQGFGDVTKIEIPDGDEYGKFKEVDRVRGSVERATTSLVGRYAAQVKSTLLKLAKQGCPSDVQCHIGECSDPSSFNTFTKAIILEDALVTTWSTEDLGALSSDEQAKVDETAEVSATDVYEVLPLSYSIKAGDLITNEIVAGTLSDSVSCGDCNEESDGCEKFYLLTKSAGGSAGTPADIVFSVDKGANLFAHDVDTLTTEEPDDLAVIGSYLVVVSNEAGSLDYALVSEFDAQGTDPTFTQVTTGIVTGKEPNAIWSVGQKAFAVGDGGYIYFTDDPTGGVSVLEAGELKGDDFNCVHALDEYTAIVGGNNGALLATIDRINWSVKTAPVAENILTVWMQSDNEWQVGTAGGKVYHTINSGDTWTRVTRIEGATPSAINSIRFSTRSVGYMGGVVSSKGYIWRTFDGGYSWVRESGYTANDSVNVVLACADDPDFVVGGGLADDAVDGIAIIGSSQAV